MSSKKGIHATISINTTNVQSKRKSFHQTWVGPLVIGSNKLYGAANH